MSKARRVSARTKRKARRKRPDDLFDETGLIRENEFLFGKDFAKLSVACLAELLADVLGYDDF